MKIYTEVVYTWDDNKGELVEESSKSFDYKGEVTLCHSRRGKVGNRYTGYRYYNIPHTHKSVADLKPKGGTIAEGADALKDLGNKTADALKEGAGSGASAIKEGGNAIANASKTNLAVAATGARSFAHKVTDTLKVGMQKLGLHKKDDPGSDTTVGSKSAPGTSATMGQGGQEGMKGASLSYVKKKTVGSGGKRFLTKIKKKGSSGARV